MNISQLLSQIFILGIYQPMLNLLLWIYSILGHNFGLAIIVFTIAIRLITYYPTVKQMKSAQAMQDLNNDPEWKKTQEKYKDDKQKLQEEQMKFYREKGVNPLSSCLPMLLQMPIWIGLFTAINWALAISPNQMLNLSSHIYYRLINASALLPLNNSFLWMKNLSQPERLDIGIGFGIPVLTILVVITTYLSSKLMTPPSQPGEQGAQMAQSMNLMMPIMMGFFAYSFSAGLAIYFITSNIFQIGQYAVMGKLNWKNLLPSGAGATQAKKPDRPAPKPKSSSGITRVSSSNSKSTTSKPKSSGSKTKTSSSKSKS